MKIATIINYSSLDNQFIDHVIEQSNIFSDTFVVAYDRFFDDTVDNDIKPNLKCKELIFLTYDNHHESRWYHNNARYQAYKTALGLNHYDYILFLDGDEVPDGKEFQKWLKNGFTGQSSKIANYWYIKDTKHRITDIEDSAVLVKTPIMPEYRFQNNLERHALSSNWLRYQGGKPLIHHYSWAKSAKILKKKVKTWGHKADNMDWDGVVNYIISKDWDMTVPWDVSKEVIKVKSFI